MRVDVLPHNLPDGGNLEKRLAGVLTETFDGSGAMTATGTLSLNGNIVAVTGTTTYSVNPDCIGTYTLQLSPRGTTAHYFFVMFDSEDEIKWICTDSGVVLSGPPDGNVGGWRQ
jgi:hypothetical protein